MTSNRWVGLAVVVAFLVVIGAPESYAQETRPAQQEPGAGATAAAVASDVFYVPGKAIVCATSGVLWIATMVVTFGSLYEDAANFVKGGCGGKWVLTGEDIKPARSY